MTTQPRDRLFLHDMVEQADKILRYTEEGREMFLDDEKTQDAVLRCFEVMGEAAKRLSDLFRDQHPDVPWKRIAGFRDVLIHGYDRVDLHYTWRVIDAELPALAERLRKILAEQEWGSGP